MILRLIVFLSFNFGALALGSYFTGKGVSSDWYSDLLKAPWTPPGWMFGLAWTIIMVCFSIYLAYLWPSVKSKNVLIALFSLQWLLNVAWNPTFFYYHNVLLALILIVALTVLIGCILFLYWPETKVKFALILPYFIWLLIASSLNGYIFFNN
ncbi:TspO/MBR family protein [Aureibacter tunicatorum]|uniref:Tryptophan-rich sensory protein n=1 Tax=Aureibacter tunicatorum TaxID=866807 RepID=A0AAE3XR70_9BACT|nr:TspO/MBR family protein [Aureibacter tunicatorum]MDR6240391.1 tryptophan-rich sensory protein [Aureibacter tunicatorum]BDD05729.1 sensory protein [Aureibacter tunicatorum]